MEMPSSIAAGRPGSERADDITVSVLSISCRAPSFLACSWSHHIALPACTLVLNPPVHLEDFSVYGCCCGDVVPFIRFETIAFV